MDELTNRQQAIDALDKRFFISGYFEGTVEANSVEEAKSNFSEFDIESMDIKAVEEIDEDWEYGG